MATSEDYPVSEQTKRLWRLELEMAEVLFDICKRHDLRVWADAGTLLGAVRHRGFIPWDDDMDFAMFREDYEKLLQIAREEALPKPYKFGVKPAVLRLYYEGTTMFTKESKLPDSNKNVGNGGNVWIDVFCIDYCPKIDKDFSEAWLRIRRKYRFYNNYITMSFATSKGIVGKTWHLFCLLSSKNKINKYVDSFINKYCYKTSDTKVSKLLLYLSMPKFKTVDKLHIFDKHWWDETVFLPFENTMLPCPIGYDEILKELYGDYLTPVKAPTAHGNIIMDLNRPYEEVVEEMLAAIPWYKRFWYKY